MSGIWACSPAKPTARFPSLYEEWGYALFEALGRGVPAIAFDLYPFSEILDARTGVLVPPRDAGALAAAIDRAAAGGLPDRRRGSGATRERFGSASWPNGCWRPGRDPGPRRDRRPRRHRRGAPDKLRRIESAEVVGICDLSQTLVDAVAERYGVGPGFTDYGEMLAQSDPDVVHVLSPPATHLQLVLAAFGQGAHAFVEKPISQDLAEYEEMRERGEQRGV